MNTTITIIMIVITDHYLTLRDEVTPSVCISDDCWVAPKLLLDIEFSLRLASKKTKETAINIKSSICSPIKMFEMKGTTQLSFKFLKFLSFLK